MNTRVIGVLAVLVLLVLGAWRIYHMGYDEGQGDERAIWSEKARVQTQQHNEEMAKARKAEQTLRNQADTLKKETSDEIARLNANVDHLLGKLRDRPKRPVAPAAGAVPTTAAPGADPPGCDGSELFGEDATFLVREGALTNYLRLQLAACHVRYGQAREKLAQ